MQITVQSGTAPAFSITGSSPEEWVEGLTGPCDWADQINRIVGGSQVLVFDRGNVQNTLSFRIGRSHANPQVAGAFYLAHPGGVPHVGTVTFSVMSLSASTQPVLYRLDTAALKVSRESWNGSRTVMRYQIVGGSIYLYTPTP